MHYDVATHKPLVEYVISQGRDKDGGKKCDLPFTTVQCFILLSVTGADKLREKVREFSLRGSLSAEVNRNILETLLKWKFERLRNNFSGNHHI